MAADEVCGSCMDTHELDDAYRRAQSEANAAFGNDDLYVETLIENARHIEVQIFGDGDGTVSVIGDRDCSLQRRHQKIIEIAPAPNLKPDVRNDLHTAAKRLASASNYRSLGTFEFLVSDNRWYFIEANARLQVEHTITEAVTGIDLVKLQLRLATGEHIKPLDSVAQMGYAIQVRLNMETIDALGNTKPSAGTLNVFEMPTGPNVRIDTLGYAGYRTNSNFDSLLAKVIGSGETFEAACKRTQSALTDFRIDGVATNIDFLQTPLKVSNVQNVEFHTRFVDEHIQTLVETIASNAQQKKESLEGKD